jgi:hypothetical protein
MECSSVTTALCCYTDAALVQSTVVAHYEYGPNAAGALILVATRYTDAAGVPIDTTGGAVAVGACAVASPDLEYVTLCDTDAAGVVTEFVRRTVTTFDAAGVPTSVGTNLAPDLATVYVPAGTVGICASAGACDASTAQGVLTTWG